MKIKYINIETLEEVIEVLNEDIVEVKAYCKELHENQLAKTADPDLLKIWIEIDDVFILAGI